MKRWWAAALAVAAGIGACVALMPTRAVIAESPSAHLVRNVVARAIDRASIELGLMTFEPPRYVPGSGTRIVSRHHPFDPDDIVASGPPLFDSLTYADDIGGRVRRLEPDGTPRWTYATPYNPRSLHLDGDTLVMADGLRVTMLSSLDGDVEARITPGIGMLSCTTAPRGGIVHVCGRSSDRENIYAVVVATGTAVAVENLTTSYARSIAMGPGVMAVADTFGHRVVVVPLTDGDARAAVVPEYYPNDVAFDDGRLLILGEHSNRLIKVTLDGGETRFLFGYETEATRATLDVAAFMGAEPHEMRADGGQTSRADRALAGDETLFSPNDLFIDPDSGCIAVADTDNHRVVFLDESYRYLGDVRGIVNPVSILVEFADGADAHCRRDA